MKKTCGRTAHSPALDRDPRPEAGKLVDMRMYELSDKSGEATSAKDEEVEDAVWEAE